MTVATRGATIHAMPGVDEIVFESITTVDQDLFEEWCEWRERQGDPMGYQLLNGRIVMSPPPGYPHGEAASAIQRFLAPFVHARQLGRTFVHQGFRLPSGDTLDPDAAFVSNERWHKAPEPQEGKPLRVVPDVAFEVLSRSNASYDRGEKKAAYAASGVREYWLVDTRARRVVVFNLKEKRYGRERVFEDHERATSLVLEGLEVPVAELMPRPRS